MKNAVLMAGLSVAIAVGGLSQAVASGGDRHDMRPRFEELDANGDGQITRDEMASHMQSRFEGADTDGSGSLSKAELVARMTEHQAKRIARHAGHMIKRHDANGDGELSMEEIRAGHEGDRFAMMDENGDGMISSKEFKKAGHMHRKHHDGHMKQGGME